MNWQEYVDSFFFLLCFCLQSRRSTAQFTVQATCAAGRPASWEQRERVRQTNMIALTSAAWWLWGESTPSALHRLTEKSRSNPLSSSHAMPWMANSLLLIKGRTDIQTLYYTFVMIALLLCRQVCKWGRFHLLFLLQSNNYSRLPSSRVAWDVMLWVLPSRWFTAVSRQASKRYVLLFWRQIFLLSSILYLVNFHWTTYLKCVCKDLLNSKVLLQLLFLPQCCGAKKK